MNLTDLKEDAERKQKLYELERQERRAEYEDLYGVRLRKLNKRHKPEPGTLPPLEPEG